MFLAVVFGFAFWWPILWRTIDPRENNRRTWNRYFWGGRLHEKGYLGYDLVMVPDVVERIDICEVEVSKFLDWYVSQGFGPSGPITKDKEEALAELRSRLNAGVKAVLDSQGIVNDVDECVNDVLDSARWKSHEGSKQDIDSIQAAIDEHKQQLQEAREKLMAALSARAYQRQHMSFATKAN